MSESLPSIDTPGRQWFDVLDGITVPNRFIVQNSGNDPQTMAFGASAPTDIRGMHIQRGQRSPKIEGESNLWVYTHGTDGGKVDIIEVI